MNYLSDISSLEAIQKKYADLPKVNVWGVEELADEGGDQFANGQKVGTDPGKSGIERPVDLPWMNSARFGQGAYNQPVQSYLKMAKLPTILQGYNPNATAQKQADGSYHGMYERTGRDLGELPNVTRSYNGYTTPDATNAINADYILDVANELDRIDPNVYAFNIRNAVTPPQGSSINIGKQNPYIALPKIIR